MRRQRCHPHTTLTRISKLLVFGNGGEKPYTSFGPKNRIFLMNLICQTAYKYQYNIRPGPRNKLGCASQTDEPVVGGTHFPGQPQNTS